MESTSTTTNPAGATSADLQGIKLPPKDTRIRTDDVTATKGLTFQSFGLSKEVLLGVYEMGFEAPSPI
jgi:ATP-dependent RNA helicase DDX6/DHH1